MKGTRIIIHILSAKYNFLKIKKKLNHSKSRILNYMHAGLHNYNYWLLVKMHYNLSVTRIPRGASRWQMLSGMEVCLKAGEMCGYVDELCKVTTKHRM